MADDKDWSKTVINRVVLGHMFSMCDWLYRQGVQDARAHDGDEGMYLEFLSTCDQPGKFGLLRDRLFDISADEWVLRLQMQAKRTSWNGAMSEYTRKAGRFGQNYLSVFYVVAKHFYIMGIRDYMANPQAMDWGKFSTRKRVKWTSDRNFKMSRQEYIDIVRIWCYERARESAEYYDSESSYVPVGLRRKYLKPGYYSTFRTCVGQADNKLY